MLGHRIEHPKPLPQCMYFPGAFPLFCLAPPLEQAEDLSLLINETPFLEKVILSEPTLDLSFTWTIQRR